jgi:hypothetical protein
MPYKQNVTCNLNVVHFNYVSALCSLNLCSYGLFLTYSFWLQYGPGASSRSECLRGEGSHYVGLTNLTTFVCWLS